DGDRLYGARTKGVRELGSEIHAPGTRIVLVGGIGDDVPNGLPAARPPEEWQRDGLGDGVHRDRAGDGVGEGAAAVAAAVAAVAGARGGEGPQQDCRGEEQQSWNQTLHQGTLPAAQRPV